MPSVPQPQRTLQAKGLRATDARIAILRAMDELGTPTSPTRIHEQLLRSGRSVNLVTIYRTISTLEEAGVLHRHPCNGLVTRCTLPDADGHHAFLHCHACDSIEEFVNPDLCRSEDRIARARGFSPTTHVSEILGTCSACLTATP